MQRSVIQESRIENPDSASLHPGYKELQLNKYTQFIASCSFALSLLFPLCGLADFDEIQDGPPLYSIDANKISDAIPKPLPLCSTGNPDSYDVNGKRYYVLKTNKNYVAQGTASWYGTKFHGKRTSCGEPYDMFAMTAASPVLPIPSFARVTNLKTGKQVIVKVNDRGPFHNGRVMDLSYAAAKKLEMLGRGTTQVKVEAIDTGVSLQLASTANPLYFQVATFQESRNANQLAHKLKAKLTNMVAVDSINQTNRVFYRVLVGPLLSAEQTEKIRQFLSSQGLNDGFPIRKT